MRSNTTYTRLTIDLPSSMHRMIKAKASLQNMSIKDFVIKAIENDVDERAVKKEFNAKTVRTIRHSIKNHDKLKSFDDAESAMKWLLSDNTKKKKPKKKNEKNKVLK